VFLGSVPERFSRLTFIHCHLDGTFWASISRYGKGPSIIQSHTVTADETAGEEQQYHGRFNNKYFDTTFGKPLIIKFAIESLGDDHIVFCSDYPITKSLMSDIGGTIGQMDLSEETLEQIAFRNSERIYGRSLI
jgi:predicted TIM-barrel fold metal-dependent hydrolase